METLVERCAGLDVHKDSVTACVRVPDGHGGRHAQTRKFTTTTAGLGLLAEWLGSFGVTRVGDGVDRLLLEAGLAAARGSGGVLAAERGPPAQRPWAEDRRGRCGLDRPTGRAWAGPPQLRAAPPGPRVARADPLPQDPDPRAHPGGPAAGQGPAGRRDQAVQRGH